MAHSIGKIALAAALGIGLAGCGGGSDTAAPAPPPVVVTPPPTPPIEDSFGAAFGTAFRTGMNTDARDPVPGDLPPLSLTTEARPI